MVHRFPVTKEDLSKYDFDESTTNLTPVQKKGLAVAGIAELVYLAVVLLLSLPIFGNPILGDENGSITAAAALEVQAPGGELALCYIDSGGMSLEAGWVAG